PSPKRSRLRRPWRAAKTSRPLSNPYLHAPVALTARGRVTRRDRHLIAKSLDHRCFHAVRFERLRHAMGAILGKLLLELGCALVVGESEQRHFRVALQVERAGQAADVALCAAVELRFAGSETKVDREALGLARDRRVLSGAIRARVRVVGDRGE